MKVAGQRVSQAAEPDLVHPRHRPLVSVVIVNFNAGALLAASVQSVLASSVAVDVWVGDNGSTDSSLGRLRASVGSDTRLHIIENHRNLGFARACNLLLAQADGNYLLVLNPDALIKPDTLERLVKALREHPDAGMAGCLIRNPDGSEQAGCRRAVPTPWRSFMRVLHMGRLFPRHPRFRDFVLAREPLPSKLIPIEAISGAFMLVRREILEQVGFFDDAYFMHCEDLDLCMRVRQAGRQILFVPDVEIVHYKGSCSKGRPIFVQWHKHKGMIRFYNKFFHHQYPWPLMLLVVCAVWTRFFISSGVVLMGGFKRKAIRGDVKFSIERTGVEPLQRTNAHLQGPTTPEVTDDLLQVTTPQKTGPSDFSVG